MGSGKSKYLEDGYKPKEMREFDDQALVQQFFNVPKQMTGLRVWFGEFIDGIETFYDY